MDQQPIRGSAPLEPPNSDVARLYLDEAAAVRDRRDLRVDTRGQGWTSIVQGLVLAVFLTCTVFLIRRDDYTTVTLLVFLMVGISQILAGITEGQRVQRRFTRGRWWYYAALVLCAAAVVGVFVLDFILGATVPFWATAAPAWFAAAVLVGIGIAQLRSARADPRVGPSERPPFERPARIATAILGGLLALTLVVHVTQDALLTSLFSIVAGAALLVGIFAGGTDWGLAYLGLAWGWPQRVVFLFSAAAVVALVVFAGVPGIPAQELGVPVAALIAVASLAVSAIPDRARSSNG